MNELSYYEILNVPSSATSLQIKESYRTLIKQYHPDKCNRSKNDNENIMTDNATTTNNYKYYNTNTTKSQKRNQFIQIQLAWECLRDSQLRLQYDKELLHSLQAKQQRQQNDDDEHEKQQKQQRNAIPIYITDCRSSIMGPELDYDNNNNNDTIDTSSTDTTTNDVDDDIVVLDWIYQCRCGYDIFVAQQQHVIRRTNHNDMDNQTDAVDIQQQKYDLIPYSCIISDNNTTNHSNTNNATDTTIDPSELFVQCIGCSLMYDLRPLFTVNT
jgi:hypothetical protein